MRKWEAGAFECGAIVARGGGAADLVSCPHAGENVEEKNREVDAPEGEEKHDQHQHCEMGAISRWSRGRGREGG